MLGGTADKNTAVHAGRRAVKANTRLDISFVRAGEVFRMCLCAVRIMGSST